MHAVLLLSGPSMSAAGQSCSTRSHCEVQLAMRSPCWCTRLMFMHKFMLKGICLFVSFRPAEAGLPASALLHTTPSGSTVLMDCRAGRHQRG